MAKSRTITIEQKTKTGRTFRIEYAKVTDRVAEFHKLHKNATIKTECEFKDGIALFRATIIPDAKSPHRFFNGTSLGKVGTEKALEKLETIAVGRALAFAGFLSDGEIASAEEMKKYEETTVVVDTTGPILKLESCETIEELQKAWNSLTAAERANKDIEAVKNELKASLSQHANPSN